MTIATSFYSFPLADLDLGDDAVVYMRVRDIQMAGDSQGLNFTVVVRWHRGDVIAEINRQFADTEELAAVVNGTSGAGETPDAVTGVVDLAATADVKLVTALGG